MSMIFTGSGGICNDVLKFFSLRLATYYYYPLVATMNYDSLIGSR